MSGRDRMICALKRQKVSGRIPHMELVFYLTMETFRAVHPEHRNLYQWNQMSAREQDIQLDDIADALIKPAKKYGHSAIFLHYPTALQLPEYLRVMEKIREKTGDEFFLMMHGDPTFSIPDGSHMVEFSEMMYEEPEKLKALAQARLDSAVKQAEEIARHPGLLDGFALCSDYCFNVNPFFSPAAFSEFVAPYLEKCIRSYREMGFYTIKHTDGNIMPIVDQMVQCAPDALHSLDPQAGVSLCEVGRLYGDKVTLIGNVNCGLLQTGTQSECEADIRRALREGMALPGYVFSTSNCIYTGMPLERYELMHKIWWEEGVV